MIPVRPMGDAVMDARSELAREREVLARADRDVLQGRLRVQAQDRLVSDLRSRGADVREAERLLRLMRETLHQWQQHRVLILQRVGYLEAKSSTLAPPPDVPSGVTPG